MPKNVCAGFVIVNVNSHVMFLYKIYDINDNFICNDILYFIHICTEKQIQCSHNILIL